MLYILWFIFVLSTHKKTSSPIWKKVFKYRWVAAKQEKLNYQLLIPFFAADPPSILLLALQLRIKLLLHLSLHIRGLTEVSPFPLNVFSFVWNVSPSRCSEGGGRQGDLQQQGQPAGPAEEAQEGPHGLHGPPAGAAGAQLRAPEVPERPGPHGASGLPEPHRHAGQDLVPESEVKMWRM